MTYKSCPTGPPSSCNGLPRCGSSQNFFTPEDEGSEVTAQGQILNMNNATTGQRHSFPLGLVGISQLIVFQLSSYFGELTTQAMINQSEINRTSHLPLQLRPSDISVKNVIVRCCIKIEIFFVVSETNVLTAYHIILP